MRYEIVPVCVGRAPNVDRSGFLWGQRAGEQVDSAHMIWVVRDEDGDVTILDTGSPDAEWVNQHHRAFVRTPDEEPATALNAAGVDPAAVRLVVLSHLHYDHGGNNHLFPRAEFVVQRSELAYAVAPYPVHQAVYEAPALGFTPRWLSTMDRPPGRRGRRHAASRAAPAAHSRSFARHERAHREHRRRPVRVGR